MKAFAGRALIFIFDDAFVFDNRVKRETKTLEGAGFKVSVVCPRSPGERLAETIGQTYVYRYPRYSVGGHLLGHLVEYACAFFFGGLLAAWVAVRRGFDVLQFCNPPDVMFPLAVFFMIFGKKFIFDHHDLCPELFETQYGKKSGSIYRVLCWAERRTLRWADGVLSTNESYRRVAIERGGKSPEWVTVVRNGPDLERFSRWRELEPGAPVRVGYLGNMNAQDGVDYLLHAARQIVLDKGRKDIEFVLIGEGDVFPRLKQLAVELGLEGCVKFTGRIPDQDVQRILSDCSMGCQPDPFNPLNNVSTMNKVMEYMALARPVVAFDLVETRVSCGEAALYASECTSEALADEIIRLADDFELRRKMGLAGRRRVEEKLAWKFSEKALLEMYRKVLNLPQPIEEKHSLATSGV
jgi:glycosyltransferase involved in cell wall biosynthesis